MVEEPPKKYKTLWKKVVSGLTLRQRWLFLIKCVRARAEHLRRRREHVKKLYEAKKLRERERYKKNKEKK